jgi:hypothetical protein
MRTARAASAALRNAPHRPTAWRTGPAVWDAPRSDDLSAQVACAMRPERAKCAAVTELSEKQPASAGERGTRRVLGSLNTSEERSEDV